MLSLIQRLIGPPHQGLDARSPQAGTGDADAHRHRNLLAVHNRSAFDHLLPQSLGELKRRLLVVSGSISANSSPPMRATTSESRLAPRHTAAIVCSTRSPVA